MVGNLRVKVHPAAVEVALTAVMLYDAMLIMHACGL